MAENKKSFVEKEGAETTSINNTLWRLKRYGRFLPKSRAGEIQSSWEVFETSDSAGKLMLSIVQSGHLLVSRGQELLEGFSLRDTPSFLKVLQKSDILLFRMMFKGESRMFRVQFEGSSRAEAMGHCRSAALCLEEYVPVIVQGKIPASQARAQPAAEPAHSATQPVSQEQGMCAGEAAGAEPKAVEGSVSIPCLAQSFLGQTGLSLPLAYHHTFLPCGDLGPFLRLCLLDQSFPAFVEKVEDELKKLAEE